MVRIGDIIINKRMSRQYEVIDHENKHEIEAREIEGRGTEVFDIDDLMCVDTDEGVWQEMQK